MVGIAIGAVGFRLIEGILASIAAIMVLVLVPLSVAFLNSGAPDTSYFQIRLVPRWISFWGLAGIGLTMVANFLVLFGLIKNFSTLQVVLNLPIAVQEMVFAVWLIAKGFDQNIIDNHGLIT